MVGDDELHGWNLVELLVRDGQFVGGAPVRVPPSRPTQLHTHPPRLDPHPHRLELIHDVDVHLDEGKFRRLEDPGAGSDRRRFGSTSQVPSLVLRNEGSSTALRCAGWTTVVHRTSAPVAFSEERDLFWLDGGLENAQ